MDISVVIPVYNVEKYLKRCVDSVLRQKDVLVELILVDDGSKDTSGSLCNEYAAQYTNIKCIHIANSGPATAKNRGYDTAASDISSLVYLISSKFLAYLKYFSELYDEVAHIYDNSA